MMAKECKLEYVLVSLLPSHPNCQSKPPSQGQILNQLN